MNKRISQSLSLQLLCGVLLSLMAAAIVFFSLFYSGRQLLDNTVYEETFMQKMADKKVGVLKKYIERKHVTSENLNQLNVWCRQADRIFLTLYKDGNLIFSYPSSGDWEAEEEGDDFEIENLQSEYQLVLADGTETHAFLYCFSSDLYYFVLIMLSGMVAFLVFSICFVFFVRRKLFYVKHLKDDLDVLAGGDLNHPVTVIGQDELGDLAYGIDQMRLSILKHQEVEAEIRSSNSKLVTAMSHDLRTPLTSLLAYLELLERGKYEDEDQMKHFVNRSLNQAMRIKTMADQLFEYFLVYSTEWDPPEMEETVADELFQQILSEYGFTLESQEYMVYSEFASIHGTVMVNLQMIRRVFDNLYSNLLKYADKETAISMFYEEKDGNICIRMENQISSERSERESTNLGLNTCRRIMEYHKGAFETEERDGKYLVTVMIPVHDKRKYLQKEGKPE
ncbi:MAG: HAMP domain-containing sensor histidine kinase [Eubacteriales bacterium]|nr:HAMP domain-containing sensor histidine kinase [Eubacteriales bacterium]